MTQTPSRDWQKDMDFILREKERVQMFKLPTDEEDIAIYWLQEAKERGEREQRMKEGLEDMMPNMWPEMRVHFQVLIDTLYPDTPAQTEAPAPEITARPIEEWHEDMGCVIWWEFPISEPPHCGTPLDMDWPGYHTHWTPIEIPAAPAPKEGK
jgi:hypothetical protein